MYQDVDQNINQKIGHSGDFCAGGYDVNKVDSLVTERVYEEIIKKVGEQNN